MNCDLNAVKYLIAISCIWLLLGCASTRRESLSRGSKVFLDWYFKDHKEVVYTSHLNEVLISQINLHLSKDTLKDVSFGLERSMVLTQTDKTQINRAIKENMLRVTEKEFLTRGLMINPDTIFVRERPEDHLKAWSKFYTDHGKGYYSFTSPIFLRDGSIAIFFVQFNCGILCSQGELAVYRKKSGSWEKWIVVNNWIS